MVLRNAGFLFTRVVHGDAGIPFAGMVLRAAGFLFTRVVCGSAAFLACGRLVSRGVTGGARLLRDAPSCEQRR